MSTFFTSNSIIHPDPPTSPTPTSSSPSSTPTRPKSRSSVSAMMGIGAGFPLDLNDPEILEGPTPPGPFTYPDADIRLITSDGVEFRCWKRYLFDGSEVFEAMFRSASEGTGGGGGGTREEGDERRAEGGDDSTGSTKSTIPTLSLNDTSTSLLPFLLLLHPFLDGPSPDQTSLPSLHSLLSLIDKYHLKYPPWLSQRLTTLISTLSSHSPIRALEVYSACSYLDHSSPLTSPQLHRELMEISARKIHPFDPLLLPSTRFPPMSGHSLRSLLIFLRTLHLVRPSILTPSYSTCTAVKRSPTGTAEPSPCPKQERLSALALVKVNDLAACKYPESAVDTAMSSMHCAACGISMIHTIRSAESRWKKAFSEARLFPVGEEEDRGLGRRLN